MSDYYYGDSSSHFRVGEEYYSGSPSSRRYSHNHDRQQRILQGIANLKNHQLPSTYDTVAALEHVKTGSTHQQIEHQVSTVTGKRVLHDIDNVIGKGQKLLVEKNHDDDLQQMIYHARRATMLSDKELLWSTPGKGTELRSRFSNAYNRFIDVIRLMVTSGEFRIAMRTLVSVLMDLFRHNTGTNRLMGTDELQHRTNEVRDDVHHVMTGETRVRNAAHHIVDVVADTTDKLVPERVREDVESTVRPHAAGAAEGKETISQAGKNTIRDAVQVAQKRMHEIEIPDSYKEELHSRLRDAVVQFESRHDYKVALHNLFTAMSDVLESSKQYSEEYMEKGKMALSDSEREWKAAFLHARRLIEHLFHDKNLDAVIQSVKDFAYDLQNDKLLLAWFQGWKNFFHKMLTDENFVRSERYRIEARQLSDQTSMVLKDRYRNHALEVVDRFADFAAGIAEDPTNREFIDSIYQIWIDACLDDNGNLTIKKELLDDIVRIMPILADRIAYVPLPRVDYDDPKYSFMMNNAVLKCNGVIPTHVYANIDVHTDFSVPRLVSRMTVRFSHIQISARGIDFEVRKKTGFIKFFERGMMDFDIFDRGLSAEVSYEPWVQRTPECGGVNKGLRLVAADVRIDRFRLSIYNTENHHLVYKMFEGAISKIAKRVLERTITEKLCELLDPEVDTNQRLKRSTGELKLSMPGTPDNTNRLYRTRQYEDC
jgi:hypothetical protein